MQTNRIESTMANQNDLTTAQRETLDWLRKHGGDGMFDRNGVALASGESAPVVRSTWNRLAALGFVEFYNPTGKGRGRLRLTERAKAAA